MKVEPHPSWSLASLLQNFRPHESWRGWFASAYTQAMESAAPDEQLSGWKNAALILGDMNACVLCLFVCFHGRSLVPPDSCDFLGHIDICLWDMKLATPAQGEATVAVADVGKPETFRRDDQAIRAWLHEQLRPFGGDVTRAAQFAMRLTAIRLGLLHGPAEPSIEQVLDG